MGKVKKKVPSRKPKTPFKKRKFKTNPLLEKVITRGMGTGAGAQKKIDSPETLYELFNDFKTWCDVNAFEKVVGVSNGVPVTILQSRALVFTGFEGYLSMRRIVFDLSHYERDDNFRPIIKQIKSECRLACVQGGMHGLYNANLTARLEGLSEKQELDVTDNRKQVGDVFPFSKTEE